MLKGILKKMIDGFIYGTGFVFFSSLILVTVFALTGNVNLYQVKTKFEELGILSTPPPQQQSAVPTTVRKLFFEPRIGIPDGYQIINVANNQEFHKALTKAEKDGGSTVVIMASGEYSVNKPRYIRSDNIMIMSESGDPYDVVIRGGGGNIFRVSASYFYLDGVTLADTRTHLIQIAGESNASYPIINNCILQDAYQQFIKVSYNKRTPENVSVGGVVKNSVFQFTRGVAKNFYTGGIDALGSQDWLVQNNIFRDLASPKERISQHAVHFWVNSARNRIIGNLFVDVDRAIGFGMPLPKNSTVLKYSHKGGEISGNVIYHADNGDPFGDTGIVLEASTDVVVQDNIIFMEHSYPNAIEYRFEATQNVLISNNAVNKKIASRDGGKAQLTDNLTSLRQSDFLQRYNLILDRLGVVDLNEPMVEE